MISSAAGGVTPAAVAIFWGMPPLVSPEEFLRDRGLQPLTWEDTLARTEARLGAGDAATFARLHRAFVAYPTEHTCRAFYDFAARHDLLTLLASHRYERLLALTRRLDKDLESLAPGAALDYGAGSGVLAARLRDAGFAVSALDLSPLTQERLASQGFKSPWPDARFDVILCADSLGEIHADEDDWLTLPENAAHEAFEDELEARYGLSHKLNKLRDLLKEDGTILVYEPVPLEAFWRGAARLLETRGWRAALLGPVPTWGLQLTSPSVPPSPSGRGPG